MGLAETLFLRHGGRGRSEGSSVVYAHESAGRSAATWPASTASWIRSTPRFSAPLLLGRICCPFLAAQERTAANATVAPHFGRRALSRHVRLPRRSIFALLARPQSARFTRPRQRRIFHDMCDQSYRVGAARSHVESCMCRRCLTTTTRLNCSRRHSRARRAASSR